jgi:hypothetical protein
MNNYEIVYVQRKTKEIKITYVKAQSYKHIPDVRDAEKIISIREVETSNGYYAVTYESPTKSETVELSDNYTNAKKQFDSNIEWCVKNSPLDAYFYNIKWVETPISIRDMF